MVEVLSVTFGVLKRLTGKKFPGNVRALRMFTEALLKPMLSEDNPKDIDELVNIIDTADEATRTVLLLAVDANHG